MKLQRIGSQRPVPEPFFRDKEREIVLENKEEYGDKGKIKLVLDNFISNALKYATADSSIMIKTVQLYEGIVSEHDHSSAQSALKQTTRVSISNKGSLGASDPMLIWERFYKQPNWASRFSGVGESSGLGLTICRRLLELHGSQYGVEENNGYVTFFFTLPSA